MFSAGKKITVLNEEELDLNKTTKSFTIMPYFWSKENQGMIIHAPYIHTTQTDLFGGYTICLQNEKALASSSEVDLYYNQESTGSVFDLGAAYYLKKPLIVLNREKISFDENDFMDNVISNWPYNYERMILKKLFNFIN